MTFNSNNRLDSLKAQIRETGDRLAPIGANPGLRFEHERKLASLESELEQQYVRNARGKQDAADRAAEQERQAEAQKVAAAEELKADLRRRFKADYAGASDQDFAVVRPQLLNQAAEEQRTANQREAASYSFIPVGAVRIEN